MALLIKNGTVITVNKQREIVKADILVDGGRIADIGHFPDAAADKVIDASDCAVMPGMINTHTHIYQALIEGIGYDMHFEPWNWRFLFPIVSMMTPEHSYVSGQVAALEMIKSGCTTVCDHWYMHTYFDNVRRLASALDESGMRSCIVYGLLDQSFAGEALDEDSMTMVHSKEELMDDLKKFTKEWNGRNRTAVAVGVGSTQDASPEILRMSQEFCLANGMQNNFHVAGWNDVLSNAYRQFHARDAEYLARGGYVGPNMVYVHAVWLTPEEIRVMAETDTKVAHCPAANAQLGYGFAPVPEMLAQGIAVGLGTDGAASYSYDMFNVMRTASYLQKQRMQTADVVTAEQAIEMATINGARVLNKEDELGSIEIGKKADIILVDMNQPHLIPVNRYVPKLVYSANGSDVKTTIIDGKVVMEDRKILTMDEKKIMEDAVRCAKELVDGASNDDTAKLLAAPWGRRIPYWRS